MSLVIAAVLRSAQEKLQSNSETPSLDAEILLAHVLKVTRTFLHTWPERELNSSEYELFFKLVMRRCAGEPIAYLVGHQEFWSLNFIVTPAVLIPRPETELIVERVLQTLSQPKSVVADLGTGSGAIAISIAHERPEWEVHATDKHAEALKIAKKNAERLRTKNIIFHEGDWCHALPTILFDAIVSNPPYVAENDTCLQKNNLQFEPQSALLAVDDGLSDLKQIMVTAKKYLKTGGWLFLEHGYQQARAVAAFLQAEGYKKIYTFQDLAGLDRVTVATKN